MRILLITDEIWNNLAFGNNVLQNWFENMEEAEFAQICATPGRPFNNTCTRYFQITDSEMLRSFIGKKAGKSFEVTVESMNVNPEKTNYIASSQFYTFMKRISGIGIKLVRELLWKVGRYDERALKKFIEDFNPDIVFCPRLLTWKLMRLEKVVSKYTSAPFIAFTGDDEASFREISYSPIYWANRYLFHRAFKRHTAVYDHYFMHSEDQAREYRAEYGVETSTLFKCGNFLDTHESKAPGNPIILVYAGRLYCNRWKSLVKIGEALREINQDGIKMILNIYTQDHLTDQQRKGLSEDKYIYLRDSVTPEELSKIYRKADIALHVESLDKKYRLQTRVSFSTKIIDLMASTCAIMAICWEEHTGYKYLKSNDAAFCVASYNDLLPMLKQITENPELISTYALKAKQCGLRNHTREKIHKQLADQFITSIQRSI